jgi:hypothetical protein
VSLTTRKNQAQAQASAGLDLARQTATRVTPVAKDAAAQITPAVKDAAAQVTPAVKDAAARITPAVKDAAAQITPVAKDAAARVAAGVHNARVWAAPVLEQAGHSISETVAPKVSEIMTATARKVEPASETRKRRWPRLVVAAALASALGGIIATVLRRRATTLPDDVLPDDMVQPPQEPDAQPETEEVIVEAEVGANGNRPLS